MITALIQNSFQFTNHIIITSRRLVLSNWFGLGFTMTAVTVTTTVPLKGKIEDNSPSYESTSAHIIEETEYVKKVCGHWKSCYHGMIFYNKVWYELVGFVSPSLEHVRKNKPSLAKDNLDSWNLNTCIVVSLEGMNLCSYTWTKTE